MSYEALRKIREQAELKALEGMTLQEINAVLVRQKNRIDELEALIFKQDECSQVASEGKICPRCGKPVNFFDVGRAVIDGEAAHVECALAEMDEQGMDDD